jgi:MHS family alpha-ketoglutarate permease-like MFS transporter
MRSELENPHVTPVAATRPVTTGQRRALFGAGIGNALEWYDWTIYAIFAPFFATQFFSAADPTSSTLATLAIFAVGFLMRPLGGIVFGWLGDRFGRRRALTSAMVLVAAGSLLIGISPTYAQIGVAASLVLLLARLLQGLAHGGEVTGSYTYLAEMAPAARRGLWSSSIYVFITLGILVATLLGAALTASVSKSAMAEWGWRVPFLIGGLLGLYAMYLRRNLEETHQFEAAQLGGPRPSPWQGLVRHRGAVLRLLGIQIGGTVAYYSWAVAAPAYAITVFKVPPTQALVASVVANLVFIVALVAAGALSDRVGRRPLLLAYSVGFPVVVFPLTWLLGPSAGKLALAMSIALVLLACGSAVAPAFFAEQLPTGARATGIGVPISVGAALFGGTAPYLQTWFATHHGTTWFTVYVIVTVLVGLVAVLRSPETRGIRL